MSPAQANKSDLVFDHLGIVVASIDAARPLLDDLLGCLTWTERVDDHGLGVSVRFARDRAGIVYELIEPLGEKSPVARVLKSRTNLLNQVAYRTRSLESSTGRLRAQGAVPLGAPAPALAFRGARVQFMMGPLGFVIELVETGGDGHRFVETSDTLRQTETV